ncbi:hypothetical protein CHARACLAT_029672 [Characodon lateralis]|uniref:Uncharacterized protein n=1 Tax=Characodon lateralis TaxID=208331 RepID=A0ABU7CSH6_9TELE|nr:hypothetical protein [Characodon lateralis]
MVRPSALSSTSSGRLSQHLEQLTALMQHTLGVTPTSPPEGAEAPSESQQLPHSRDVVCPSPEKFSGETLDESLKDELTLLEEPEELDDYINLAIRLDNRMRERRWIRSERSAVRPHLVSPLLSLSQPVQPPSQPEPEPMHFNQKFD